MMIQWPGGRAWPAVLAAIDAAGITLECADGVPQFDVAAVQAIIDAYDPLPEARAEKWREIQAERDRRKFAGYVTAGHRYHSDADSRTQQLGLVMAANAGALPPGLMWKTMDGAFVPMSAQLALGIFSTAMAADAAVFAAAETHRAAINAMTDVGAVLAYDFSGGWPVV